MYCSNQRITLQVVKGVSKSAISENLPSDTAVLKAQMLNLVQESNELGGKGTRPAEWFCTELIP
jgi:hypothetical protein